LFIFYVKRKGTRGHVHLAILAWFELLETAMSRKKQIWVIVLFVAVHAGISGMSSARADWQNEYDRLRAKIEKEENEPHHGGSASKNLDEYITWLGIKADDRSKARELAGKAQLEGSPYWQNKFIDLAELAQDSGNSTLWTGAFIFMRVETKGAKGPGDSWEDAVFKAGPSVGHRLFEGAADNGFDKEIVRDYARCLMRFANGDVEEGYTGIYEGRRSEIGHFDQDGIFVLPTRNFDVTCERRDEFTTVEEGEPKLPADIAMEMVDEIREQCEWYKLQGEYDDATDLMQQYLQEKKVLCDLPPNKGHYFFLHLAEEYELPKAEEHIDGFYATIYGKVEIEAEKGRKPAVGAKVTARAPKDKDAPKNRREWTTTADEDGKYRMDGVILHKDCSPFEITAKYRDIEEETEYVGPLEEPDPYHEYEKDILIKAVWEGTIESTFETGSKGDESLISSILLDKGEFKGKTNWKMDVVFKLDRGNKRVKIYGFKSARFRFFDEVKGELELEEKGRKVTISGTDETKVRGRALSPSECNLELIIDLEKKKYKIEGLLRVANIPSEGEGRLKIDVEKIQRDERDSEEGMEEYTEQVFIEGRFLEESPVVLEGTVDEIEETPLEFREFLRDIAGEVSGKIRWKLERKGEH